MSAAPQTQSPDALRPPPFLRFFRDLREARVPVTIGEYLTFLEAIEKGLHDSELTRFYYVSRSVLVKSEAWYDAFDRVFEAHFGRLVEGRQAVEDEMLKWLEEAKQLERLISPEELEKMRRMQLDLAELLERFEEKLNEQEKRHDGGDTWIGTGGTSLFGNSGFNTQGVRVGGNSGQRSAMQVIAKRSYRDLRTDVTLDVRQFKVALRRLRQLTREGLADELDLDETIDRTCQNAGELELAFRPPRRNNIKLLMLYDVGGSMDFHIDVVDRLFTALHELRGFKELKHFYFHNCIYERVYADSRFREPMQVPRLLREYDGSWKVIVVGDAYMHPYELTAVGGAIDYDNQNRTTGIDWMRRVCDHFERVVWLNPEPENIWNAPSIRMVRSVFPMYRLTVDGMDEAVRKLVGGRSSRR